MREPHQPVTPLEQRLAGAIAPESTIDTGEHLRLVARTVERAKARWNRDRYGIRAEKIAAVRRFLAARGVPPRLGF